MVFLKDILKVPYIRAKYQNYAKRYDIYLPKDIFIDADNKRILCMQINAELANAIYKIYFECDYPKYKDLEFPIKLVKDFFEN